MTKNKRGHIPLGGTWKRDTLANRVYAALSREEFRAVGDIARRVKAKRGSVRTCLIRWLGQGYLQRSKAAPFKRSDGQTLLTTGYRLNRNAPKSRPSVGDSPMRRR